jgi:hypothetical protein
MTQKHKRSKKVRSQRKATRLAGAQPYIVEIIRLIVVLIRLVEQLTNHR